MVFVLKPVMAFVVIVAKAIMVFTANQVILFKKYLNAMKLIIEMQRPDLQQ